MQISSSLSTQHLILGLLLLLSSAACLVEAYEYVPFCLDPMCDPGQSELMVTIENDWDWTDNEWVLEKLVKRREPVEWEVVETKDLDRSWGYWEDTLCLDPESVYRWTITDSSGDGFCYCGYIEVVINRSQLLLMDYGEPFSEETVAFLTPSKPRKEDAVVIDRTQSPTGEPIPTGDPTESPTKSVSPTGSPVLVSTPVPSVGPTESPSESHAPTTVAPSLGPSASLEPTAPPTLSPPPSLRPSVNACDGEDEDLLTVEVRTETYYFQNSWVLETRDDVGSTDWTEVASNNLPQRLTVYSDRVCLEAGRSYRWTFTDTGGNGFVNGSGPNSNDAYYRVNLNGEEIVSPGDFECKVIKEIGPVECVDEKGEHRVTNENGYGDLQYSCRRFENRLKFYGRGGLRTICNYPLVDGSGFLYDKCKVLCAPEGLGPCADDNDALS